MLCRSSDIPSCEDVDVFGKCKDKDDHGLIHQDEFEDAKELRHIDFGKFDFSKHFRPPKDHPDCGQREMMSKTNVCQCLPYYTREIQGDDTSECVLKNRGMVCGFLTESLHSIYDSDDPLKALIILRQSQIRLFPCFPSYACPICSELPSITYK